MSNRKGFEPSKPGRVYETYYDVTRKRIVYVSPGTSFEVLLGTEHGNGRTDWS